MKVIINIPKVFKNHIDKNVNEDTGFMIDHDVEVGSLLAIKNGTPIPDNATNREVLQIVFPSLFKIFKPYKKEKVRGKIKLWCDGLIQETKAKWLDEPYK